MDNSLEFQAKNLAANLSTLRKKRDLSQLALSKLARVPRSTIAHLETGSGNPSLMNLTRVCWALQVPIEELLSRPRPHCLLVQAKDVPAIHRAPGRATIFKLLPDAIPGMVIDRMEIEKGGRLGGIPHVAGTREYLCCVRGEVTLSVAGEKHRVQEGDVLAFPGDQPHSYLNTGVVRAVCFSVVTLARS